MVSHSYIKVVHEASLKQLSFSPFINFLYHFSLSHFHIPFDSPSLYPLFIYVCIDIHIYHSVSLSLPLSASRSLSLSASLSLSFTLSLPHPLDFSLSLPGQFRWKLRGRREDENGHTTILPNQKNGAFRSTYCATFPLFGIMSYVHCIPFPLSSYFTFIGSVNLLPLLPMLVIAFLHNPPSPSLSFSISPSLLHSLSQFLISLSHSLSLSLSDYPLSLSLIISYLFLSFPFLIKFCSNLFLCSGVYWTSSWQTTETPSEKRRERQEICLEFLSWCSPTNRSEEK